MLARIIIIIWAACLCSRYYISIRINSVGNLFPQRYNPHHSLAFALQKASEHIK